MADLNSGPTLLILGVAKAGTTTLFNLLDSLPQFMGCLSKEPRYFSMNYFYEKGPDWYHAQFNQQSPAIKFEAAPHYLYFPHVPERVAAYQQQVKNEMKFIVLLREPAARCYSAWNMERSFHKNRSTEIIENHYKYYNPDIRDSLTELLLRSEFPSFQQAVSDDINRFNCNEELLEPSYVRKGLYARQVLHWLNWFGLEKFLFIEYRELSQHIRVIQKIGEFLNVEIKPYINLSANLRLNVGDYLTLSTENRKVIAMLKKLYTPHNEKLFEIIGKRFDWND